MRVSAPPSEPSSPARRRRELRLALALVVVLGVVGLVVLGPALMLTLTNVLDRLNFPQHTHSKMDIGALQSAVETYAFEHGGEYPESLEALVTPDSDGRRYLKNQLTIPEDSWGRPYVYFPSVSGRLPRIVSYGADGKPGGTGADRDIDSATFERD